ncbi:MAG: hypothetical protein KAH32_00080 [Chlamydiia bacterium]|nr:hypothetical protein [Chlamydiia bacterium]
MIQGKKKKKRKPAISMEQVTTAIDAGELYDVNLAPMIKIRVDPREVAVQVAKMLLLIDVMLDVADGKLGSMFTQQDKNVFIGFRRHIATRYEEDVAEISNNYQEADNTSFGELRFGIHELIDLPERAFKKMLLKQQALDK